MQSRGLHVISASGLLSNVWLCAMLKSIALKSIALQTVCLLLHGFPRLSVSLFMRLILLSLVVFRHLVCTFVLLHVFSKVLFWYPLETATQQWTYEHELRTFSTKRLPYWSLHGSFAPRIYIIILREPRWFNRLANSSQMLQAVPHWRSAAFSLPNYFIQWG